MKFTYGATVVAALLASSAAAQSGPNFTFDGYVAAGNLFTSLDTQGFYAGSVNVGGTFLSLGAGDLGFDLGLDAAGTLNGDLTFSALYPTLTYSFGGSKVSLGNPRSAFDSASSEPDLKRVIGPGGVEVAALTESSVSLLSYLDGIDVYGAGYSGTFGAIGAAATYHRIEGLGNSADALAVSGTYDAGLFTAFGAYETVSGAASDLNRFKIGAQAEFAQFSGGASYSVIDATGTNTVDVLRLYGAYAVTDRIDVGLDAFNVYDGTDTASLYSVSGKYNVLDKAYVEAAYVDGNNTDAITSISIGYDF